MMNDRWGAQKRGRENEVEEEEEDGVEVENSRPPMKLVKLQVQLRSFGLTDDDIRQLTEMGFDAWQHQRFRNQPHNDESLWYIENCNRQEAEEFLKDSPTGTFLIRPRSVGHYALSIMCNAQIHHCIIYQTDSGFGFAAPYNIYSSLKTLVDHYESNSLEEHNDTLTTTLRIPVLFWHQNKEDFIQDEYEFRQQQQQQQQQIVGGDEINTQQEQQQQQLSASSLPVGTSSSTIALSSSSSLEHQHQQHQSVIVSGVATLMQNGLSSYDTTELRNATASPPPDIVMSSTPAANVSAAAAAASATSSLSSASSSSPFTYPRYNSQHNP